jgi:hypothetical protein
MPAALHLAAPPSPRHEGNVGEAPRGSSHTLLHCAHRTSIVSSCAFCEQEGWPGYSSLPLPSSFAYLSTGWPGRSSNARVEGALSNARSELEALLSWRAACLVSYCARPTRAFGGRALREHRRPTGCPPSSLFEEPPNPRLNLVQPIAQVGLKDIGLGLHFHTLGLELVLEQHQLGE